MHVHGTRVAALGAFALLAACGGSSSTGVATPADTTKTPGGSSASADTIEIPLIDMGAKTYNGFAGGLYAGGSNAMPSAHAAAGLARAKAIRPLDVNGNPSASGKYVLLSIGMSNTTQEFCSQGALAPCDAWTFMGQAAADQTVNHTTLAIVNGAAGGKTANMWESPTSAEYDRIRDSWLRPQGLSEKQVQIAWVKGANAQPTTRLPSASADAYVLETETANVVRALKQRYPNLQQVFLSSRTYGGWATTTLNPEPYAYETGFAMKWVIQAQIDQMQRGGAATDARAGDLNYNTVAPWIAWGAYLWTSGLTPRSDGLTWTRDDTEGDGTHPSRSGEQKVGSLLLDFFKTSAQTKCWFLAGQSC